MDKNVAIILAAGRGTRFKDEIPKQFVKLAGLPVVVHTIKAFQMNKNISDIIVVTLPEYIEELWNFVGKNQLSKVKKIVIGGATRQESSYIGINSCDEDTRFVLIHDAVRPFISQTLIDRLIKSVKQYKAVDTVIPSADTIVKVDEKNFISEIPNRATLRRGQTPQAFDFKLIKKAHKEAIKKGIQNATDDCSLVLNLNIPVYTITGDEENIKITYPLDIHIADKLFQLKNLKIDFFPRKKDLEKLKDNVIIVIGGTSGIGKAIAKELIKYKARVYPLSRRTTPKLDVTNLKSVKNAFNFIWDKEKRIDCIINSAGMLIRKNVEFMNIKEWEKIYNTNIKGAFIVAKTAISFLKKQNKGHLIFIASSSYTRGRMGYSAYSSSKAALVNFCQALAEELLDCNIKVNVLSPSRVKTPMREKNFGKEDVRTLLTPEYVAKECLKVLISDITGSIFDIT